MEPPCHHNSMYGLMPGRMIVTAVVNTILLMQILLALIFARIQTIAIVVRQHWLPASTTALQDLPADGTTTAGIINVATTMEQEWNRTGDTIMEKTAQHLLRWVHWEPVVL